MGFVVFIKKGNGFTDVSQTNINIILGVRKSLVSNYLARWSMALRSLSSSWFGENTLSFSDNDDIYNTNFTIFIELSTILILVI